MRRSLVPSPQRAARDAERLAAPARGGRALPARPAAPAQSPETLLSRAERLGHRVAPAADLRPAGAGPAVQRQPQIAATEEAIGESVVAGMGRVETEPKGPDKGVHYVHNYERNAKNGQQYKQDAVTHGAKKKFAPYADFWKDEYRSGYADPKYWERTAPMVWRIVDNVSAVEAIQSWLQGVTIAECFTTLMAIQTDTLRKTLGDANFDYFFGTLPTSSGTKRLTVGMPGSSSVQEVLGLSERAGKAVLEQQQSKPHGEETAGKPGKRPLKKGEWVYFYNHPKYLLKHPGGAFQGENALYVGERESDQVQLFSGFGVSQTTEDQLYGTMVKEYDGNRTESDFRRLVSDHAPGVQSLLENTGKSWQELYEKYKGQVPDAYREDKGEFPDKINDVKTLLAAPPYTLGTTTRAGGFVPSSGSMLAAATLKTAVPAVTKARLTAQNYGAMPPEELVKQLSQLMKMKPAELEESEKPALYDQINLALAGQAITDPGRALRLNDEIERLVFGASSVRKKFALYLTGLKQLVGGKSAKANATLDAKYVFGETVRLKVTSGRNTEGVLSDAVKVSKVGDRVSLTFRLDRLLDVDGGPIGGAITVRLVTSGGKELRSVLWQASSDDLLLAPKGGTDYIIDVAYQ